MRAASKAQSKQSEGEWAAKTGIGQSPWRENKAWSKSLCSYTPAIAKRLFTAATASVLLNVMLPLAHAQTQPTWVPTPTTAHYTLQAGGMTVGESTWTLREAGAEKYHFDSRTEPVAPYSWFRPDVVTRQSVVRLSGNVLDSERYHYAKTGGKRERKVTVNLNWKTRQATIEAKGQTRVEAIKPGTLDQFSYLLAVMRDLSLGKAQLSYAVASRSGIEVYAFERLGQESVDTPAGKMNAIKLRRLGQDKRQTTIWFATLKGYWPIQIRHEEKDDDPVIIQVNQFN